MSTHAHGELIAKVVNSKSSMKINVVLCVYYEFKNESDTRYHSFDMEFEGMISMQALPRKDENLNFLDTNVDLNEDCDFIIKEIYHDILGKENVAKHEIWCESGPQANPLEWEESDGVSWIEKELIPRMKKRGFKLRRSSLEK